MALKKEICKLVLLVKKCGLNRQKHQFKKLEKKNSYFSSIFQWRTPELEWIVPTFIGKILWDHLFDGDYEMINEESHSDYRVFNIFVRKYLFVKARIKSRHIARKQYLIYILLDLDKKGLETFKHHYCQCKTGDKTIVCCSHILHLFGI